MTEPLFPARIVAIRYEAVDTLSFLLAPIEGSSAVVDPGAHVDVHLPNGMMRSYSLSNGHGDDGLYRVTVARDANSQGGSTYMHDELRAGQVIEISAPRNNFSLAQTAPLSVFIAGGIGVTPFVPMIVRLNELGQRWRLHYCVRTQDRAALLQEITALAAEGHGELLPNFDGEPGGQMLDLAKVLGDLTGEAHVYCCGPAAMLDAFRSSAETAGIPSERVHFEYFSGNVEVSAEGGFVVHLQKSNLDIAVNEGETILRAVTRMGIDVPYSCEDGVCGACQTGVLAGVPDHRDLILSDRERAENNTMMICCSGSKSARLVLDL